MRLKPFRPRTKNGRSDEFRTRPNYPADLIRALSEKQARLSALLDPAPTSPADFAHLGELHYITVGRLVRLLRPQWQAQADADAHQALIDSTNEILEEMEKEASKEK